MTTSPAVKPSSRPTWNCSTGTTDAFAIVRHQTRGARRARRDARLRRPTRGCAYDHGRELVCTLSAPAVRTTIAVLRWRFRARTRGEVTQCVIGRADCGYADGSRQQRRSLSRPNDDPNEAAPFGGTAHSYGAISRRPTRVSSRAPGRPATGAVKQMWLSAPASSRGQPSGEAATQLDDKCFRSAKGASGPLRRFGQDDEELAGSHVEFRRASTEYGETRRRVDCRHSPSRSEIQRDLRHLLQMMIGWWLLRAE
jgi:hypothetical protein